MGPLRMVATTLAGLLLFLGTSLEGQQPQAEGQQPQVSTPEPVRESTADTTNRVTSSPSDASKVRIVRLSEIPEAKSSEVQVDLNTGNGYENSVLNMPITEGTRLNTLRILRATAEVEFEDLSTLRIIPGSEVEFTRLERLPSGVLASTVKVMQGTVYVSLRGTKGNSFELTLGQNKLVVRSSSHLRVTYTPDSAQVAVFAGEAQFLGAWGIETVGKGRTLRFEAKKDGAPTIAKKIEPALYDIWDKNEIAYHNKNLRGVGLLSTAYGYGADDLGFYGSFANRCGQRLWQPYLTSAQWDPFSVGYWVWYPGSGYSWVSPYPWGWLPYHSGGWTYCPDYGWGWLPGGPWVGLTNLPLTQPQGPHPGPRPPIRPPRLPGPPRLQDPDRPSTGVAANRPARPSSVVAATNGRPQTSGWNLSGFVLRRDSAGLGVPRGIAAVHTFGNLSHAVQQHGSAVVPVQSMNVQSGSANTVPSGPAASSSSGGFSSSGGQPSSGSSAGAMSAPPPSRGGGNSGGSHRTER